jgi:hypothetical protein
MLRKFFTHSLFHFFTASWEITEDRNRKGANALSPPFFKAQHPRKRQELKEQHNGSAA